MRDLKSLLIFLKGLLTVAWPLSAAAAAQTFGASITELSFLSFFMTLVISSLSGLTALLHHMKKDLEKHGKIKNLWLYVSSKMLGSNVAGLLMMFWSENSFDPNTQACMIIIAAFGGTWFLERVLVSVTDKIVPKKEAP